MRIAPHSPRPPTTPWIGALALALLLAGCKPETTAPISPPLSGASAAVQLDAQLDAPPSPAPQAATSVQVLLQLVAPIALYPDKLVAQVLTGALYPEQVSAAELWLGQHPGMTGQALADAVNTQTWDPSVKSLTQFPNVLSQMASNLPWTRALGSAYAQDTSGLMGAIQTLRESACDTGQLKSGPQLAVRTVPNPAGNATETSKQPAQIIVIEPTQPQTVYVPQYNPRTAFGDSVPLYSGYQPAVDVAQTAIAFGTGVVVGRWIHDSGWGWQPWDMRWGPRRGPHGERGHETHATPPRERPAVLYLRDPYTPRGPHQLVHSDGRPDGGGRPGGPGHSGFDRPDRPDRPDRSGHSSDGHRHDDSRPGTVSQSHAGLSPAAPGQPGVQLKPMPAEQGEASLGLGSRHGQRPALQTATSGNPRDDGATHSNRPTRHDLGRPIYSLTLDNEPPSAPRERDRDHASERGHASRGPAPVSAPMPESTPIDHSRNRPGRPTQTTAPSEVNAPRDPAIAPSSGHSGRGDFRPPAPSRMPTEVRLPVQPPTHQPVQQPAHDLSPPSRGADMRSSPPSSMRDSERQMGGRMQAPAQAPAPERQMGRLGSDRQAPPDRRNAGERATESRLGMTKPALAPAPMRQSPDQRDR